MMRITIRCRRTLVLTLASLALAAAIPTIALASGSQQWCTGCYEGAGATLWWNTYHSEINATQAWDYYDDGAGNCAGVWQTTINAYAGVICHRPGSGYNTSTCSVADTCLSADTPGHAAFENYANGGAWYFSGYAWWDD
jgi:hypothetical protein